MELLCEEIIVIFHVRSFLYRCNLRGNCITGYLVRASRNVNNTEHGYWECSEHRHKIVTLLSSLSNIHYVMSDSQNILLYICKQYINIIQQNVATDKSLLL
jgi:hypothetical protein